MIKLPSLFLCHHSPHAAKINVLAQELRLRGVPPWVDKDGGFGFEDISITEARRVIADPAETFGLLFYATPKVFESEFIREVELTAALDRKDRDSRFMFPTVVHDLSRKTLAAESLRYLNVDLNKYHGGTIRSKDADDIEDVPLRPQLQKLARDILEDRLPQLLDAQTPQININFCTRDHLSLESDDILDIDARAVVEDGDESGWQRLVVALRDVKKAVRQIQAAPIIRVQGSKHLTAAFLFGRTFAAATVRELRIRQGEELWSSRICDSDDASPLGMTMEDEAVGSRHLFVEVGERRRLRPSVRRFASESGILPTAYLRFERPESSEATVAPLDAGTSRRIARQVADTTIEMVQSRRIEKIHLFVAAPQALHMLLGHYLKATVPIQLYEFDGTTYKPSICVNEADFKSQSK